MKPRSAARYLFAVFVLLVASSCSILTPTQRSQARIALDRELAAGHITAAQHGAAAEALDRDEPFDWEGLGFAGLNMMLALVGGPMVVRRMRGPPTQKVGLPQEKVRPASG